MKLPKMSRSPRLAAGQIRAAASQLGPDEVLLIVEGPEDALIAKLLIEAAGYPGERVKTLPAMGDVYRIGDLLKTLPQDVLARCAVLVDMDEGSLPDALARAREQLGETSAEIFCAVPVAEAWLFADEQAALAHAPDDQTQAMLQRLPLPEEIPDPKGLARWVFGSSPGAWGFLMQIDIQRACARSSSLRSFLSGMGRLLGVPHPVSVESVARSLTRDLIAGLIGEMVPSDAVAWRTAGGEVYTAAELRRHIEAGSEVGRQYATDLLRVARDFLKRMAQRSPAVS